MFRLFGIFDWIELAVATAIVVCALLWRGRIESLARQLAVRTRLCMMLLGALPVVIRLILLPRHPIPTPGVSDDFSYLLLAETLLHFRLANPVHPLHRFFETFFVLQEPSYSSIFPLGQGLVLALGQAAGHPWIGVALSIAVFSALCYWMLRAWTTPTWALLGGILAACEFGPLNQWMNSYWGGAVSATAGCLVIGSLPRLRQYGRTRDAILLGTGLGLQLLTRPFEFLFLLAAVVLFGRVAPRLALTAALAVFPAILLILLQNHAVTGSWTTLPYQVSRYQYGVPAAFTLQPNPVPHRALTREQQLDYEAQSAVHGAGTDTVASYLDRLLFRLRYYRFFFLPPLYLALPFFLPSLRKRRFIWVLFTLGLFAVGTNFYPYFYSHYIAAVTCLFVLVGVVALERLSQWRPDAARVIVYLCFAHFLFWYGAHAVGAEGIVQYDNSNAINTGDPDGRIAINRQLEQATGKQLVFVRYAPQHQFKEWVHNAADIDGSRVVWARDLGTDENAKLRSYYPDRKVWLLEPDAHPPRLNAYP